MELAKQMKIVLVLLQIIVEVVKSVSSLIKMMDIARHALKIVRYVPQTTHAKYVLKELIKEQVENNVKPVIPIVK